MLTKLKNGIKNRLSAAKTGLKKFDRDEKGLEALQVILIIAIAAIILALLKTYWQEVKTWFKTAVDVITGKEGFS